ncbi:MAG: hypothetical protein QM504_17305 [Pseudomonadota bacterium]
MKFFILSTIMSVIFFSPFLNLQANAELPYPVAIDAKAAIVNISKIKIQNLLLSGIVKKRSYNSHVAPGHIKYFIVSDKEQILKQGVVEYSPTLSLRSWRYGSRFSFVIPENLPAGAHIRLGWHHNQIN